jgi:hypothetical protein
MSDMKTSAAAQSDNDEYRKQITEAYEGEIYGAAFFAALADRFAANEERRRQLEIMRDIEVMTAERMLPVVTRLNLPPANRASIETAARSAAAKVIDWAPFIEVFHRLAPGFVAKFNTIVAVAPPQDRDIAQFLVDHEVAFVDFTEKEIAGKPGATDALERLLASSP